MSLHLIIKNLVNSIYYSINKMEIISSILFSSFRLLNNRQRTLSFPFLVIHYLRLTRFYDFVANNIDTIIWDTKPKAYAGHALIHLPYPPRRVIIKKHDKKFLRRHCYGSVECLATRYCRYIIHEAAHWYQFLKWNRNGEDFPMQMELEFEEMLAQKLFERPRNLF